MPITKAAVIAGVRAAKVAHMAYSGYKAYRKANPTVRTQRVTDTKVSKAKAKAPSKKLVKRAWRNVSTATYAGMFAKPKAKQQRLLANQTDYLTNGYMLTEEIHGRINDSECVYIGHSTYDRQSLATTISCAVLRKLFRRAGITLDQARQELPLKSYGDSSGFQLRWVRITSAGVIVPFIYEIPDNTSLRDLSQNSGFQNQLFEQMENADGSVRGTWDRISLYSNQDGGRLFSELNLRNEVIQVEVQSTLSIQNRTKGASAGVGDTGNSIEIVDNQPLTGYIYAFNSSGKKSNGTPEARQMGNPGLKLRNHGVLVEQHIDLVPSSQYIEPPSPKIWSNCDKSARILLQPGTIKQNQIRQVWRGYFNNICGLVLVTRQQSLYGNYDQHPGKTVLCALEETLNSGSTNLITCAYEANRVTGCKLFSTKGPTMPSDFQSFVISNQT